MTCVLLPDFVGYPLCYLGVRRRLPAGAAPVVVDYNDHWPYTSIDELATALAATLPPGVHTLVGYSFGALVATAVARRLPAPPALVLIDPPASGVITSRAPAALEATLRARADYAYVFDAIDAELTSLDVVLANLALATDLDATGARGTVYLAAGRTAPTGALDAIHLPDTDHRSIIDHPLVVERIIALL